MPHKHKRKAGDDPSSFDLPPSTIAKPLATHQNQKFHSTKLRRPSRTARSNNNPSISTDTPRAFASLLNFHQHGTRLRPGLDDGKRAQKKSKKRKLDAEPIDPSTNPKPPITEPLPKSAIPTSTTTTTSTSIPTLQILPHERLSAFSARVDQALPISGLATKGRQGSNTGAAANAGERKTRHNKRLEKMQKAWREEEARRVEKREAEVEEMEDEGVGERERELWDGVVGGGVGVGGGGGGKRGKTGKRKRKAGGVSDGDGEEGDPWAGLARRREETKQKNLQDVVTAPPELDLKFVGKGGLKERGATVGGMGGAGGVFVDVANVPGKVGSLRKREELGKVRRDVIAEYRRKMMGRQGGEL